MASFFKYFVIALLVQLPLLTLWLVYKPAELVLYFVYMVPLAIVGFLLPFSNGRAAANDCNICLFLWILIPASFYAAIFAWMVLFIRRRFVG